jgi:hypothetical protein
LLRPSSAFVEGFAPLRIGQNPHEQAGRTQRIGEAEYTKFGWALKAVFYARERQALSIGERKNPHSAREERPRLSTDEE